MKNSITITHTVFIDAPQEKVWDYTQDYSRRAEWDDTVLEAQEIASDPRTVQLKLAGNQQMTFVYKLDNRPRKTTLAAKNIQSGLIRAAGGAWEYERRNEVTRWTQTNTIVFKNKLLLPIIVPIYKWLLTLKIKKSMSKAKMIIERF